jgi:hypothetical protein
MAAHANPNPYRKGQSAAICPHKQTKLCLASKSPSSPGRDNLDGLTDEEARFAIYSFYATN